MGLTSFACKIEGTFITVNDIWRCSVFNHIYSLQPSSNNKNHLYIVCVVNTAPLRLSKNCIMLNTIIGGSPYTTLFCRITKHIKCQYNVYTRKSGIGIMAMGTWVSPIYVTVKEKYIKSPYEWKVSIQTQFCSNIGHPYMPC